MASFWSMLLDPQVAARRIQIPVTGREAELAGIRPPREDRAVVYRPHGEEQEDGDIGTGPD